MAEQNEFLALITQYLDRGRSAAAALAVPAIREHLVREIAALFGEMVSLDLAQPDAPAQLLASAHRTQAAKRLYDSLVDAVAQKNSAEQELRKQEERAALRRETEGEGIE
jgi:hypothetical protein